MKNVFALLYILLCLCWANPNITRIENSQQIKHVGISTANYNALCVKTTKTITNSNIYLATKRKTPKNAYYYGCDSTGRKKVNVALDRNPDNSLLISINVLIEGDLNNTEAQTIADELMNSLNAALSVK